MSTATGVNADVQEQSPGVFSTGLDLLDGSLNAYFQLQAIKEQTKLAEAQSDQEAARSASTSTTQTGAEPSLVGAFASATAEHLAKPAMILLVLGVVGFVLVKD